MQDNLKKNYFEGGHIECHTHIGKNCTTPIILEHMQ